MSLRHALEEHFYTFEDCRISSMLTEPLIYGALVIILF
jgi:hypothetical protein